MTDTFTWGVTSDASGDGQLSTSEAKFGDGYSQDVALGLNGDMQKWSVTYAGYRTDAQAVLDFIRAHRGVSFFWTPPLGVEGYYKCKTYKPRHEGGGFYTIALEFMQAYAP